MKIRVARDTLAPAVSQVARHISSKPTSPELGGMVLETFTDQGQPYLRLIGFDGESTGKAIVPIKDNASNEPGRVLVNGPGFADVVRDLPSTDITLEVVGSELSIQVGRGKFALPLMEAEHYPTVPKMPAAAGTVSADLFATAVSQVGRAFSKEVDALSGIRLEATPEKLTLVATDRYRLALRSIPWKGAGVDVEAYVAGKSLAPSANQFSRSGDLRIGFEAGEAGSGFGLASDAAAVVTSQLDFKFPAYRALFPKTYEATATVNIAELASAVKRVGKFVGPGSAIKLSFSDGLLKIAAADAGLGSGSEEIEIGYEGEAMELSCNPAFLNDGLAGFSTDTVKVNMTNPAKPVVLTSAGDEFTYLLSPVRAQA